MQNLPGVLHSLLVLSLFWATPGVARNLSSSRAQFVDDLDTPQQLNGWRFSNGPEFPGANGQLVSGPGFRGPGSILKFTFTCSATGVCGRYVAAIRSLELPFVPQQFATMRLSVRIPPEIALVIRVRDETGQTLQYRVEARTLEQPHPTSAWQSVGVPLWAGTLEHWGGRNTGKIEGKLEGFSILAEARFQQPSRGQLEFDEIAIASSETPSVIIDPRTRSLPELERSRPLASLLGVSIHSLVDDSALDITKDAGFSFVRADIFWNQLEQANRFQFAAYDRLLAQLRQRGLGVLWVLGYGHPNHGGKYPASPEDLTAFARYASAVASHFPGSDCRFEIWNEPDVTLGDPKVFASIVKQAATAIHNANPAAQMSSGGLAKISDDAFLDQSLSSHTASNLAAIGVHPYRSTMPETVGADLWDLQAKIARVAPRNLQVWDTEWGYSSYSDEMKRTGGNGHSPEAEWRQGVMGVREILSAWASGFPVIVWYDLIDDNNNPVDREGNYGLLRYDHTPKPVLSSIQTLSRFAAGRHYTGLVSGQVPDCHTMRLENRGELLFIAWNTNRRLSVDTKISNLNLQSVKDLLGRDVRVSHAAGGNLDLKLAESDGPVFIRYKL